jgi:hypothetical protein
MGNPAENIPMGGASDDDDAHSESGSSGPPPLGSSPTDSPPTSRRSPSPESTSSDDDIWRRDPDAGQAYFLWGRREWVAPEFGRVPDDSPRPVPEPEADTLSNLGSIPGGPSAPPILPAVLTHSSAAESSSGSASSSSASPPTGSNLGAPGLHVQRELDESPRFDVPVSPAPVPLGPAGSPMDATSAAFAGSPGALSAARRAKAKAKAKARPSARVMSWTSDSGSANVGAQQCLHMNNVSQFLGPWQSDRIHTGWRQRARSTSNVRILLPATAGLTKWIELPCRGSDALGKLVSLGGDRQAGAGDWVHSHSWVEKGIRT